MEQRRNVGAGKTGDPLENPPTNGIVRHDSHLRKSGEQANRSATVAPVFVEFSFKTKSDTVSQYVLSYMKNSEEIWADLNSEVLRANEGEVSTGMKGLGKREIPEETRRPAASSSTIPTCENSDEPGSAWWEVSSLTAWPPWPLLSYLKSYRIAGWPRAVMCYCKMIPKLTMESVCSQRKSRTTSRNVISLIESQKAIQHLYGELLIKKFNVKGTALFKITSSG
ncbi:hypothetical protein PR048_006242 [Dryococelus australis]|uniref:Uncharacterized protein n=1 Tax=Dryococelus australis TaxID=614101 RepID=A0ABQ9IAE5_9NEOP|nr:hypothetical protein PR048_006242 [Dryococelus australis]